MLLTSDKLLIATRNRGKAEEFRRMFGPRGIQVLTLNDLPDAPEIVEDGDTFRDNAGKKAKTIAIQYDLPVLADDSGLCVEALNGAPGVYSARYAGENASDADNNRKLLAELMQRTAVPDDAGNMSETFEDLVGDWERTGLRMLSPAKFVCVLALYDPVSDDFHFAAGECPGMIVDKSRGGRGFGYDPYFFVPEYGRTMAELDPEEKNRISHRGRALRHMLALLED